MGVRMLTEVDWIEIDADLLAAEHPLPILSERHDLSIRSLERRRAVLKKRGYTLRTADAGDTCGRYERRRA